MFVTDGVGRGCLPDVEAVQGIVQGCSNLLQDVTTVEVWRRSCQFAAAAFVHDRIVIFFIFHFWIFFCRIFPDPVKSNLKGSSSILRMFAVSRFFCPHFSLS